MSVYMPSKLLAKARMVKHKPIRASSSVPRPNSSFLNSCRYSYSTKKTNHCNNKIPLSLFINFLKYFANKNHAALYYTEPLPWIWGVNQRRKRFWVMTGPPYRVYYRKTVLDNFWKISKSMAEDEGKEVEETDKAFRTGFQELNSVVLGMMKDIELQKDESEDSEDYRKGFKGINAVKARKKVKEEFDVRELKEIHPFV